MVKKAERRSGPTTADQCGHNPELFKCSNNVGFTSLANTYRQFMFLFQGECRQSSRQNLLLTAFFFLLLYSVLRMQCTCDVIGTHVCTVVALLCSG